MRVQRVTIKDVAAKAGVGISVVSYVLNNTPGKTISEPTKERIFEAVRELEYTPNANARGMRIKKSLTIGLVSFWNVSDLVFVEILEGVTQIADEKGYNILFCSLNNHQKAYNYVDLFKQQQIDGVILISPHDKREGVITEKAHIEIIKKNKIPAVVINGDTQDEALSYIYFDYYSSAYMATEYLLRLGHRKIGYLTPFSKDVSHLQAQERLRGFREALQDHGVDIVAQWVSKPEEMDKLIEVILEGKGPTGLVTNKSDYGQIFMKQAIGKGVQIPKDISVIAANTENYTPYLFPALTSVHLPMKEIGQKSAEVLFDILADKMSQVKLKLPCRIEERESCKSMNQ